MTQGYYTFLKKTFRIPRNEGQNKVIPLKEAIQRYIKPQYKIHITREASAAASEIVRQYQSDADSDKSEGKNPGFVIITSVFTGNLLNLFFAGLVSRVVASLISHIYPSPYPVKAIIEAHQKGLLEIESWSLYTLQQRLMAGALGVSFLPAKSISGTTLAVENSRDHKVIEDPFDQSKNTGVISALQPDISILHACVADPYGNAILPVPYEDNIWGPRASREGVILTAERLVSTSYIRAHSALVRLPGYMVKSVSLAPFGAHPLGLFNPDMKASVNYAVDYDFLTAYRKAGQSTEAIKEWLRDWVISCKDQEAYIRKLGQERTKSLKERAAPEKQKDKLKSLVSQIKSSETTPGEWMTIAACRQIMEKVLKQGYRTILAGIGSSYLAATVAYYLLRENSYVVDIVTGGGQMGFSPFPGDPSGGSIASMSTCKMLTDSVEAYGTIAGGQGNKCLSVLGISQIDPYGSLNTSRSNGAFLIGTGGASDATQSRETIVVGKASRERLLESLSYISTPGKKVRTFVSQLGIMEKSNTFDELQLTHYFPYPGTSKEDIINSIRKECGWELKISPGLKEEPPPTKKELLMLRALDPQAAFTTL